MDQFVKKFKRAIPATYPISMGQSIKLGDYGVLENGFFIKKGDIVEDFKIAFNSNEEQYDIPQKCEVLHGSSISFLPEMKSDIGGLFTAGVNIHFAQKYSFYYQSTICSRLYMTKPKVTLNDTIMGLYKEHAWEKRFVIITAVLLSNNMLNVESDGANQEVTFTCESHNPISSIDDIKVSAKISYKSSNSTIRKHSVIGDTKTGIAFELQKIKGLWSKSVERLSASGQQNMSDACDTTTTYEEYMDEDNDPYNEDIRYELVNIR